MATPTPNNLFPPQNSPMTSLTGIISIVSYFFLDYKMVLVLICLLPLCQNHTLGKLKIAEARCALGSEATGGRARGQPVRRSLVRRCAMAEGKWLAMEPCRVSTHPPSLSFPEAPGRLKHVSCVNGPISEAASVTEGQMSTRSTNNQATVSLQSLPQSSKKCGQLLTLYTVLCAVFG